MKSFIKLLVDIGPLAIFFIFYTRSDLQSAIIPFMIATIIAVIFWYFIEKKNTRYASCWRYNYPSIWWFDFIF